MRSSRFRSIAMFAFTIVAGLLSISEARADTRYGCVVKYVNPWEYNYNNSHNLMLQVNCESDDYHAYSAATAGVSGCGTTVSIESLKAFMSISQSALLSKRNIDLTYIPASGNCKKMITGVALSAY